MSITREHITGLVLAGGRGTRMGGVDKGLQAHHGEPLVAHALRRLAPQVGPLWINANRSAEAYAAFGVPVCPDTLLDYPGPLAGFLAGLQCCTTPWLVTVPCDSPGFPLDLVQRLAEAVHAAQADVAVATTLEDGQFQAQPVFCLMKASLADHLADYLKQGQRKIDRWTGLHTAVQVPFDDAAAFFNINTLAELQRLQST